MSYDPMKYLPHGEEGSLQLDERSAIILARILLKKGYAILLTGGDIGDDLRVSWLYAGDVDNLEYSNYDNVVFAPLDAWYDYLDGAEHD